MKKKIVALISVAILAMSLIACVNEIAIEDGKGGTKPPIAIEDGKGGTKPPIAIEDGKGGTKPPIA
ncbi:MAG: hypothetical protein ACRDD7_05740 [Peptostreptococcaceae bacterium]